MFLLSSGPGHLGVAEKLSHHEVLGQHMTDCVSQDLLVLVFRAFDSSPAELFAIPRYLKLCTGQTVHELIKWDSCDRNLCRAGDVGIAYHTRGMQGIVGRA